QMFPMQSVWIAIALAAVCASCRPSGDAVVEARRSSTPPATHTPPVTATAPRIVFLGDSLTPGYALAKDQSLPSFIEAHLRAESYPYEGIKAGVSGDTSAGGLSRLDWSLDGDVRILVLELGANDGLRGLPVENMKRNLAEVITRAQARGIKVVLTGMEAPP